MKYIDKNNRHYSTRICDALIGLGWQYNNRGTLQKRFTGVAPAGMKSNGDRVVTARFCERNRYLKGEAGWQQFDIDGRHYCESNALYQAAEDFDSMAYDQIVKNEA